MKTSKSHIKAVNKYIKANYDRITVLLPKGKKDIIKQIASSRGMSVNGFVKSIIEAEISRCQTEPKNKLKMHTVKKKPPIDY